MTKLILMMMLAVFMPGIPTFAAAQRPPGARRSNEFTEYHGQRVADPYRWMEDLNAIETRRWAAAQDSFARAFLHSPHRVALRQRLGALNSSRATQPPILRAGHYFWGQFASTGGTAQLSVFARPQHESTTRELRVTANVETQPVRRLMPARKAALTGVGIGTGSGNWQQWVFLDVVRGALLPDTLLEMHSSAGIAWESGDRAFLYARYRMPPSDSVATARLHAVGIFRHQLGQPQSSDVMVYAAPNPECTLAPFIAQDGSMRVIRQSCPRLGSHLLHLRGNGAARITTDSTASYRFAGSIDNTLYWQTDEGAPNHKVVSLSIQNDQPRWRTVVPEDTLPLFSWGGSPLGANLIGRTLLLAYQKDAVAAIKAYDLDDTRIRNVVLPEVGSIWSGFVGTADSNEAFYSVSSLASPGTIYRMDVTTGRSEVWSRPAIDLPLDSLVTEQVFVRSKDGTRLPMFIVRRSDLKRDGSAAAWMYGYGFGDWSASPWFQPYVAEFVYQGGVWALPNLRGGAEYGERWNEAGSRTRKQNTVDDYIAAAEYLIEHKYTSAKRIVANASSAGGVVAASAVIQRPELFGAGIFDFPVLDMLRYHLFTVAGTWRSEYGTVDDSAEFRVLRSLSAPHALRPGLCYPPILVTPGEKDETTPPFHAYKFVAEMQHANGCDAQPALLRISWGAGHNFGKSTDDILDNWTDQLLFVKKAFTRAARPDTGSFR
jgi:prolyl oligopeptidase